MALLFEPLTIRNKTIRNRICLPPMVIGSFSDENGMVTRSNIEHYAGFAKGGVGLIIQESTSPSTYGKVAEDQLGIWHDDHIPGHRKIAEAVHAEGAAIVMQLCHAGVTSIEEETFCPSAYSCTKNDRFRTGTPLTLEHIRKLQDDFVNGAVRAWKAGYDGIELHGAHRYLICQFLNKRVNKRDDRYGRDRTLFAIEIVRRVRELVPEDFILGIRLGAFEPALEDGIAHAVKLAANGCDYLNISYGCTGEFDSYVPEDYPFKDVIYAAGEIRKHVEVPVFAVNGIRTPEAAESILKVTGVDAVNIGRSMLVNPNWANDAMASADTGRCLECRGCQWHREPPKCPGRKLLLKKRSRAAAAAPSDDEMSRKTLHLPSADSGLP